MATATVTSKGQITIPKEIRDRLGLAAGDRVRFRETADGVVVLEPETGDLMTLFGVLSPQGGRRVSLAVMNDAIRKAGGGATSPTT